MKYALLARLPETLWQGTVSVWRILPSHLFLMCAKAPEREAVGSGALEVHSCLLPGGGHLAEAQLLPRTSASLRTGLLGGGTHRLPWSSSAALTLSPGRSAELLFRAGVWAHREGSSSNPTSALCCVLWATHFPPPGLTFLHLSYGPAAPSCHLDTDILFLALSVSFLKYGPFGDQ